MKIRLLLLLVLLSTYSFSQTYVDTNATGIDDGSSWTDAYNDLQDALANASDGDEIWIAQGVYKPSTNSNTESFNINTINLTLYGGFNGTETQLTQRDFRNNVTILSGDINGNDDNIISFNNATRTDNSISVVKINASNISIDGLQINNGHANQSSGSGRFGAAIQVGNGQDTFTSGFTLKNCEIKNNVSYNGGNISAFYTSNATVLFENTKFDNNLSRIGGVGYFTHRSANTQLNLRVYNCLFSNNKTADRLDVPSNTIVTGISGSVLYAAPLSITSYIDTRISNSTFVNNIDSGTSPSTIRGPLDLIKYNTTFTTHQGFINNNIFFNNIDANNNTSIAINGGNDRRITSLQLTHCIDEDGFSNYNNGGSTQLNNNQTADPLLTDLVNNDFTLQTTSPAINAGSNSWLPSSITTDLAGNQRIVNATIDIGVYEFDATLSVSDFELSKNEIKLYPNPATSVLNIEIAQNLKQAAIYNLLGTEVLKTSSKTIDVSNLSQGIYILKITSVEGTQTTKRFIKQ